MDERAPFSPQNSRKFIHLQLLNETVLIMINKKKTSYEILAVSPNASDQEIQANYENLVSELKSQKENFNPDEYNLKLKIINLAFDTLSTPTARAAYDAKLLATYAPAGGSASSNALALPSDPSSIALRAEAISLRAEAISLRADALSIKSVGTEFDGKGNYQGFGQGGTFSPLPMIKKFIMLLGGVVAAWMVIQVLFLMTTSSRQPHINAEAAAKAEEKLIIQEYYQTHGVRVSSRAEVERLEAENRRQENERRTAEREKERQEEMARRFEQESRQRADEVSERLRYAEEQARERADREEAQKKWQEEERKRLAEEAEFNRIQREKDRWQETLRR
jgi:curved DNA-binding protein CbpA